MESAGTLFQNLIQFLRVESYRQDLFSDDAELLCPMGEGEEWIAWLKDSKAVVDPIGIIEAIGSPTFAGEARVLFETQGKKKLLPIAFSIDRNSQQQMTEIRVYHSMLPILGGQKVYKPVFQPSQEAQLPEDLKSYDEGLLGADVAKLVSLFSESGNVTDSSGSIAGTNQKQKLGEYFGTLLRKGGIQNIYHSCTDNGTAAFIEYTRTKWGVNTAFEPQAGLEIFDRKQGKIQSLRIYHSMALPV